MTSFNELLLLRVGFAAAQATQNPICFSLIPELFPRERTTAMAAYNSAIYMGRALSFAAVIIAGQLGVTNAATQPIGVQLVRPPHACLHPHKSNPFPAFDKSSQPLLHKHKAHLLQSRLCLA